MNIRLEKLLRRRPRETHCGVECRTLPSRCVHVSQILNESLEETSFPHAGCLQQSRCGYNIRCRCRRIAILEMMPDLTCTPIARRVSQSAIIPVDKCISLLPIACPMNMEGTQALLHDIIYLAQQGQRRVLLPEARATRAQRAHHNLVVVLAKRARSLRFLPAFVLITAVFHRTTIATVLGVLRRQHTECSPLCKTPAPAVCTDF